MHLRDFNLFVFFYCIPAAAHFAADTARSPARHHSVSTPAATTPTKEGVAMPHLHDDDDNDVTQPRPSSSVPNPTFPNTFDAPDAAALSTV